MYFDYQTLKKEMMKYNGYGKVVTIDISPFGHEIFAIVPKRKKAEVIIFGGIHAREHITCKLVLEMAKKYTGERVMFIPMINPDGIELCLNGINTLPEGYRKQIIKLNGGEDFSLWKANGRGVDLEKNFDVGFKENSYNHRAGSEGYPGVFAFSEREARTLYHITEDTRPKVAISYHCKGEVIYYGYKDCPDFLEELQPFSEATGYPLRRSEEGSVGYKDWFLYHYKCPAMTIEVGENKYDYPFPYSELDKIMTQNEKVPYLAEELAKKMTKKK